MNFEPSADQMMIAETFARFLNEHSSMERVRAALPLGFDEKLWKGIGALGGFGIRVPENSGGLGLGLFDAALLMEQVGRTLASGPIAETILAARLLAASGESQLLEEVLTGTSVITLALHDLTDVRDQWLPGGAVAKHVIGRKGGGVHLFDLSTVARDAGPNLASTAMAKIDLGAAPSRQLAGTAVSDVFAQCLEEWKLLTAAALSGLSLEAIRLATVYASEREQFGQLIGTYQGISHPLAERFIDADGGRLIVWKAIRDLADRTATAGAQISLALWWTARSAGRAVTQALQTFGGYGLTTEYDIHLYNLRAKAWPLIWGDPALLLTEAGRRLYASETVALPDVGAVSINFDLGEEAHRLAAETDAFFRATLTPELKAKAHYSFDGHDPDVHRKLAEAGLLFLAWPVEMGGRGASPYAVSAAMGVWEEYGWTSHALGTTQIVGWIIASFGSDELKRDVLSKIMAGEVICSLGFSEPASGSDVFAAKTRATPSGNGWRIDGQKMFTSGANLASYVLLLTRTDPEALKHKGLTMFIVPLQAEGVAIQPVYTFQDERTNITYYDAVQIPDSYRLGEVNGGSKVMAATLELEHSASFVRTQQHMLKQAEIFCKETTRGGRLMIEDQAVMARLASVYAGVMVSEMLSFHTMWSTVQKLPNRGLGSISKLFSSERFKTDSADLLDLMAPDTLSKRPGPAAFINQSYRHAHGGAIYGGTSEIHRSIVAERTLGLPRSRA